MENEKTPESGTENDGQTAGKRGGLLVKLVAGGTVISSIVAGGFVSDITGLVRDKGKEATVAAVTLLVEQAADTEWGKSLGLSKDTAAPLAEVFLKKKPADAKAVLDKLGEDFAACEQMAQADPQIDLSDPVAMNQANIRCLLARGHREELEVLAKKDPYLAKVLQQNP